MNCMSNTDHLYRIINNPQINVTEIESVDYRTLWEVKILKFLYVCGVVGSKYDYVYRFIIKHINLLHNRLYLNDKQIVKHINDELKMCHKNLHTEEDAINDLKRIIIEANHKPFIARKRYGKYGRKSYLTLNSAVIPNKNDLNHFITIEYSLTSIPNSKKKKIDYLKSRLDDLNNKSKIINGYKNSILKKLSKI